MALSLMANGVATGTYCYWILMPLFSISFFDLYIESIARCPDCLAGLLRTCSTDRLDVVIKILRLDGSLLPISFNTAAIAWSSVVYGL